MPKEGVSRIIFYASSPKSKWLQATIDEIPRITKRDLGDCKDCCRNHEKVLFLLLCREREGYRVQAKRCCYLQGSQDAFRLRDYSSPTIVCVPRLKIIRLVKTAWFFFSPLDKLTSSYYTNKLISEVAYQRRKENGYDRRLWKIYQ